MKSTHRFSVSRHLAAFSLAIVASLATAQPASTTDPRGQWVTASGNLEVDIAPCGAALCGTVTKVLANRSMSREGAPMEAVDSRPALGMALLKDFVPVQTGDGNAPPSQWTGEIYNRENGKTYRCQMSMQTTPSGATELLLHAYVGIPLFGKTQRWQRVASSAAASNTTATQH